MKLKRELLLRSILLGITFVIVSLGLDYLMGNLSWLGSGLKVVLGMPIAALVFYTVLAWRQKRRAS